MIGPVGIRLEGSEFLANLFRGIEPRVRDRIFRKAGRRSARPIIDAMRAGIPIRTGALKKSIGFVVRHYRASSKVVVVIGARWDFGAAGQRATENKIVPAKYIHLVDAPTAAQKKPYLARRGGKWMNIKKGRGPTVGVGFVERAATIGGPEAVRLAADELRAEVGAELDRTFK